MTTARTIIYDALQMVEAYGQDANPTDSDAQLGLRTLQRMIDSWSNDAVTVYASVLDSLTLVSGTASYSSSLLSARPLVLNYVYVVDGNNVSYDVFMVDAERYAEVAYKPGTGIPTMCWFNTGFATSTLTFYPTPISGLTAKVSYPVLLQSLTTLDTVLSLPPGYERAIVSNLAIELAPSWGKEVSGAVVKVAGESKGNLGRTNLTDTELSLAGVPSGIPGPWNWLSGDYS